MFSKPPQVACCSSVWIVDAREAREALLPWRWRAARAPCCPGSMSAGEPTPKLFSRKSCASRLPGLDARRARAAPRSSRRGAPSDRRAGPRRPRRRRRRRTAEGAADGSSMARRSRTRTRSPARRRPSLARVPVQAATSVSAEAKSAGAKPNRTARILPDGDPRVAERDRRDDRDRQEGEETGPTRREAEACRRRKAHRPEARRARSPRRASRSSAKAASRPRGRRVVPAPATRPRIRRPCRSDARRQAAYSAACANDAEPAVTLVRGRRLSLFDVLCIGVNATVGSGVFALPGRHAAGDGRLVAARLRALRASCSCRSRSRSPSSRGASTRAGGAYVYARHAFGERVGFVIGWYCWANTFVSWAANTTLFVELVRAASPDHPFPHGKVLAVVVVVGLGAVNYFGVKPGALVVNARRHRQDRRDPLLRRGRRLRDRTRSASAARCRSASPASARASTSRSFRSRASRSRPSPPARRENPRRNVPLGTHGRAALLRAALRRRAGGAGRPATRASARTRSSRSSTRARYLGPRIGVVVLVGSLVSIGGFTAGSALGFAALRRGHRLARAPAPARSPRSTRASSRPTSPSS